ncbi:hypothetical protein FNL56_13400 [Tardiphaga sp. vice304]|uniref:hypothetical protein n=1 Tax=Tardiphaga sp. vice304 TaxID=2592817 RepID=UPI0011637B6A|nr:hypothetical protein [Tardiphaga sp. vice304]QDM26996.1 hypothetical protein FNL56_13400 [Tardiphaga sp. vice304]
MTLARTALRLCVAACLKGSDGDRPTMAEGRVYDSRIAELSPESFCDDAKATVILMTDGDEGEALSAQNGGPPFKRMIDVVVEMGMVMALNDEDGYVVGYPDTDARLEASLDLLEFQIMRRLAYAPAPMSVLFRKFTRIRSHQNHRQVLDDSGVKIACRILTLTCEVNDDRVQVYQTDALPTGFAVLPEPLRSVALVLPDGSPGHDACVAIAAGLAPLAAPGLLNFDVKVTNPNDAPDVEALIDLS